YPLSVDRFILYVQLFDTSLSWWTGFPDVQQHFSPSVARYNTLNRRTLSDGSGSSWSPSLALVQTPVMSRKPINVNPLPLSRT
ncbi:MAG TPA: hypothetical protein VF884_08085, partial [Nitrososphaeraceae archaeon]